VVATRMHLIELAAEGEEEVSDLVTVFVFDRDIFVLGKS